MSYTMSMKVLNLTNGVLSVLDDHDYNTVSKHKWYAVKHGGTFYVARTDNRKTILLHRELLKPPEGMVVDHINRIGLDNRRSNLRVCTHQENMQNLNRRGGVDMYAPGRWRYRVTINSRQFAETGFSSMGQAKAKLTKVVALNT